MERGRNNQLAPSKPSYENNSYTGSSSYAKGSQLPKQPSSLKEPAKR